MSTSVFPKLPGTILLKRSPLFKTTLHEAASGKEDRTSWQSGTRYRWDLQCNFLREAVMAPAPWGAYSEAAIVEKFFTDMQGSSESFHIIDPFDDTTDRTVRFVEDSFAMGRICAGVWKASLSLISVL